MKVTKMIVQWTADDGKQYEFLDWATLKDLRLPDLGHIKLISLKEARRKYLGIEEQDA